MQALFVQRNSTSYLDTLDLRCLSLRASCFFIMVDVERLPVIENLTVHFNHTGGNASLHVNSLTLRKLHVGVPGKNNWGLLELHAPNLELFMFVGGYSVCCQGARAVADTRVRLPRLKAFRWDISNSDSYGNPGWYTHAQLDGMVQCEGSAEIVLSKLLLDPLRIEAVGIALSPQGFERLKAASHSPFALPLYLQALSLEQHASGASGMHFELPMSTSTYTDPTAYHRLSESLAAT